MNGSWGGTANQDLASSPHIPSSASRPAAPSTTGLTSSTTPFPRANPGLPSCRRRCMCLAKAAARGRHCAHGMAGRWVYGWMDGREDSVTLSLPRSAGRPGRQSGTMLEVRGKPVSRMACTTRLRTEMPHGVAMGVPSACMRFLTCALATGELVSTTTMSDHVAVREKLARLLQTTLLRASRRPCLQARAMLSNGTVPDAREAYPPVWVNQSPMRVVRGRLRDLKTPLLLDRW